MHEKYRPEPPDHPVLRGLWFRLWFKSFFFFNSAVCLFYTHYQGQPQSSSRHTHDNRGKNQYMG